MRLNRSSMPVENSATDVDHLIPLGKITLYRNTVSNKLKAVIKDSMASSLFLLSAVPLTSAVAAETLTLSSWLPPTHPIVVNAIKP